MRKNVSIRVNGDFNNYHIFYKIFLVNCNLFTHETLRSSWVRAYYKELEFGNVVFWGEVKTGLPGEKPLGARERTNNKLNPGRRRRDFNPDHIGPGGPGHIGGRRVLSPLRHPLLPCKERVKDKRSNGKYFTSHSSMNTSLFATWPTR